MGYGEGLLRECLEIIGSLAIRNQDLDRKLLYVADELVRDCMALSISDQNYYLLVHSTVFSDSFSKTYARIIRQRFPAWTLWNLPLVAHEVGHVANAYVLKDERDQYESLRILTPFLENEKDSLAALDATAARPAEEEADSRLRVLLADAFATYAMGPAYACTAIMLRLNPASPVDSRRAHVVLCTLRCMNGEEGKPGKPYDLVIGQLEDYWGKALARRAPAGNLTDPEKDYLKRLAESYTRSVAPQIFSLAARYPEVSTKDGWPKAQAWANGWRNEHENEKPFVTPDTLSGKLRDVLNAAWQCRLMITGDLKTRNRAHGELAVAATTLCQRIIDLRDARPIGLSPGR